MGGYFALRLYERSPHLCQILILCGTGAGADNKETKIKRWESIKSLQKDPEKYRNELCQKLMGKNS